MMNKSLGTLVNSVRRVQPLLGTTWRAEISSQQLASSILYVGQHRSPVATRPLLVRQCHNLANNQQQQLLQQQQQQQQQPVQSEIEAGSCIEDLKMLSYKIVKKRPTQVFHKQYQRAKELTQMYYDASPLDKFRYISFLSDEFYVSIESANHHVNFFVNTQSRSEPYDPALLIDRLRNQVRPHYLELFRVVAKIENGVKFLTDLRGDMITFLANSQLISAEHQSLSSKVYLRLLSSQLAELLSLWFSAGFVRLERLTWDSPTSLLQKISDYEAVHPIKNWMDLKNRVGLYRRCYMFAHSCLPGEPLVILHVALLPSISSSIQEIIQKTSHQVSLSNSPANIGSQGMNEPLSSPPSDGKPATKLSAAHFSNSGKDQPAEDPKLIDAAIFYSISSTQKGLNGIDLGNQLIKQVAAGLKAEFPLISQFSTLSPIPNFNEYLFSTIQSIRRNETARKTYEFWTSSEDFKNLRHHILSSYNYTQLLAEPTDELKHSDEEELFWNLFAKMIRSGEWIADTFLMSLLEKPLMSICAHYLYAEKRRGFALNSVANFHLKNGAVMWRLNWLADTSHRGLNNSCGIMVNYRYYLDQYLDNSIAYLNERRIILGSQFASWIDEERRQQAQPPPPQSSAARVVEAKGN